MHSATFLYVFVCDFAGGNRANRCSNYFFAKKYVFLSCISVGCNTYNLSFGVVISRAIRCRYHCISAGCKIKIFLYSPRDSPQRQGGASVANGISQSCAGETFGYAAQGRSQRPQTYRVDAPWYGTRAMQVTTPRGQNCARRVQFFLPSSSDTL